MPLAPRRGSPSPNTYGVAGTRASEAGCSSSSRLAWCAVQTARHGPWALPGATIEQQERLQAGRCGPCPVQAGAAAGAAACAQAQAPSRRLVGQRACQRSKSSDMLQLKRSMGLPGFSPAHAPRSGPSALTSGQSSRHLLRSQTLTPGVLRAGSTLCPWPQPGAKVSCAQAHAGTGRPRRCSESRHAVGTHQC